MRVTSDRIGAWGVGRLSVLQICYLPVTAGLGCSYRSVANRYLSVTVGWCGCHSCRSIYEICNLENQMLSSGHCGDVRMIEFSDCTESTIESMTDMSLGLR
jgi:hypothetical protein